jgi:hypothetical protein
MVVPPPPPLGPADDVMDRLRDRVEELLRLNDDIRQVSAETRRAIDDSLRLLRATREVAGLPTR